MFYDSELQQRKHGLWRTEPPREDDTPEAALNVSAPHGLFPASAVGCEDLAFIDRFRLLGRLAGKVLQDGRLMDLPLNSAFYRVAFRGDRLTISVRLDCITCFFKACF